MRVQRKKRGVLDCRRVKDGKSQQPGWGEERRWRLRQEERWAGELQGPE